MGADIATLTDKQLRVLGALILNGPLTYREIADQADVSLGYAHDVFRFLRKKGFQFQFTAQSGRGYVEYVSGVTPEEVAAFEQWLSDPENWAKWQDALTAKT